MKQIRLLMILLVILVVAGCQRDEDPEEIAGGGGTFVPLLSQPEPVALEQLAANPQAYLDQYIQLSGRYTPVSELICIADRRRTSPASWSISDGNLIAKMGGFDMQVNELLPADIEMTVNGIWRFWEGLVGCGKQAQVEQIWYLDATQIVSPSPLVRITLTPSGEIALNGSPSATALPTLPTGSPAPETASPPPTGMTNTPTPETTPGLIGPPAGLPTATLTSTATFTPTPAFTATASLTTTISPTAPTALAGSPTAATSPSPSATSDGTTTPSATTSPTSGPSPTPAGTATATPNAAGIIVQGNINSQSLVVDTLTENVAHQFNFTVNAGETISVSLVMIPDDDPSFQVVDPDGDVIAQANSQPAGVTESLLGYTVLESGQYAIVLREASGNPADYAMTLGKDSDSFVLVFNGPLLYDQSASAFIKDSHLHYWHFFGERGTNVTITVDPTGTADMAFRLRDPLLQFLDEDYTNDGEGGEPEVATFALPATGLYTIDVEEWDFAAGEYRITITVSR